MTNTFNKTSFEIKAQEETFEEVEKEVSTTKKSKSKQKQISKTPEKQYYNILLETLIPTTLTYRVLAESPEEALDMIKTAPLSGPPKLQFPKLKKIKASIFLSGTSIIKLTKNF